LTPQKGGEDVVVGVDEILIVCVLSSILSVVVVAVVWPRLHDVRQLAALVVGIVVGIVVWNVMLNLTNAVAMNVDSAYRVSGQDVGSGVFALAAACLALGLVASRGERANRVVGVAAVAGLVTLIVDLFA
jgi:hypothetical protein